jgi:hypothetical protein
MCTYLTDQVPESGSGKGATGWLPLTTVTTYFDHPVHAEYEHTMNVDFANPSRGASSRVALELCTESAVALIHSMARVLADVPTHISGVDSLAARSLLEATQQLSDSAR